MVGRTGDGDCIGGAGGADRRRRRADEEVDFVESAASGTAGRSLRRTRAGGSEQVDFELSGIDGDKIEGQRVLFRARSSGISKARMERLTYDIPRPGRDVLRMTGLGAPDR